MPIAIGDEAAKLEYVQAVAPVLLQFNSVNGLEIVYGIEPESFRGRLRRIRISRGPRICRIRTTYWWTTFTREGKKVKVGQTLHVLEHDFHVAGIVEHGKGARLVRVALDAAGYVGRAGQGVGVFHQVRPRGSHAAAVHGRNQAASAAL